MRQFILRLWPGSMLSEPPTSREQSRQEYGVYETVGEETYGLENVWDIRYRLSFGDVLWKTIENLAKDHQGRPIALPGDKGLFYSKLWTKDPPRGQMFIWAYPKSDGGWNTGLGYWTVSGEWRDAYNGNGDAHKRATRFHPMPEPPSI